MDWNEIKSVEDFGQFNKLKGIDLKSKISQNVPYSTPYFKMCYLKDIDRVFIMRCNSLNDDWVPYNATKAYGGLLNLSTKYWKSISPLNHGKLEPQSWFDGVMTYDKDGNCVYVMDGGKLNKYDLQSKKWIKNINDKSPGTYIYDEIMWIDPKSKRIYVLNGNTLYWLNDNSDKWNAWKF